MNINGVTILKKLVCLLGEQEYEIPQTSRFNLKDGSFSILNVESSDEAFYLCVSKNGVGDGLQKKVSLTVIGENITH